MLVLTTSSLEEMLQEWISSVDTYFHLYSNNVTLSPETTLADLVETIWAGYLPIQVDTWTPVIWTGTLAASFADQISWTSPGLAPAVLVYGYFVTDGPAGPLLWAEARPGGPLRLAVPGETVNVWPQITSASCTFPAP